MSTVRIATAASGAMLIAVMACGPRVNADPVPTALSSPRATQVRVFASPTAMPSATETALPRLTPVFAPSNIDPFAAFYATERDGIYVTSRNSRARYFYRWDDRRWFALDDRVWFRTTEELQAVFPGRVAAP